MKVNRYQATYQKPSPAIPIIPNVKDSEFHGPEKEIPKIMVLSSKNEPIIAGAAPLALVSFPTLLPKGIRASNRLNRKVIHEPPLANP